ncbi:hypothetical protein DFH09DRAFT_1329918 [Mycena vulgaris]|nr:hypothetical protein DFH09DRAFT_1329918 [Mycena vulgaris]
MPQHLYEFFRQLCTCRRLFPAPPHPPLFPPPLALSTHSAAPPPALARPRPPSRSTPPYNVPPTTSLPRCPPPSRAIPVLPPFIRTHHASPPSQRLLSFLPVNLCRAARSAPIVAPPPDAAHHHQSSIKIGPPSHRSALSDR